MKIEINYGKIFYRLFGITISLLLINEITFSQMSTDHVDFNINKIKIVLLNNGTLGAYDSGEGIRNGQFEESNFIFSGGFLISGFVIDSLFANGNFNSEAIANYDPGTVGSNENDPQFKLYVVKSEDSPFSQSWTDWQTAVSQGARFYDSDGDGIYKPVDKNNNGQWDENEDRPDLLGDMTVWCVFNDNGSMEWRREDFRLFAPVGFEIRQTVFAWNRETGNPLNNVIFIRYVIEQKGLIFDTLKNVLFGIAADPDLGNHNDDLAGCIPTKNLGYAYNEGADSYYGDNPPSFGLLLLKGPEVFIPGETFIDNNFNGVYDPGIDTPITNAEFNHGSYLGSTTLEGAANLDMSAFVHGISSSPVLGSPNKKRSDLFNYLQAKKEDGSSFSVADWWYGNGDELGAAADTIPFHFMYSGDPVAGTGWLDTFPADSRTTITVGPFDLVKGETKEILYAYIVGRGTDPLNSITEMIKIADSAQKFYDSNFSDLPVDVLDEFTNIPSKFELHQNYPNPFNAETVINFSLAHESDVEMVVYNILGQKIATLVNDKLPTGQHNVKLNAVNFTSGIYFVTLRTGGELHTIKVSLMK